eukprot:217450_1
MSLMLLCVNICCHYIVQSLQSCDTSHFPEEANDEVIGSGDYRDASSLSECMVACCNEQEFYCSVYQFCNINEDVTCNPQPSCWIGHGSMDKGEQTGWQGRQRPDYPTSEPTKSPTNENVSSNVISGGWIFIIIFVTVLTCYCLIGCIYNGKQNENYLDIANNIPNYSLWKLLPKLTITGCKVTYDSLKGLTESVR